MLLTFSYLRVARRGARQVSCAPVDLQNRTHHQSQYLPAFAVTTAAVTAALAIAVLRLRRREI